LRGLVDPLPSFGSISPEITGRSTGCVPAVNGKCMSPVLVLVTLMQLYRLSKLISMGASLGDEVCHGTAMQLVIADVSTFETPAKGEDYPLGGFFMCQSLNRPYKIELKSRVLRVNVVLQ